MVFFTYLWLLVGHNKLRKFGVVVEEFSGEVVSGVYLLS